MIFRAYKNTRTVRVLKRKLDGYGPGGIINWGSTLPIHPIYGKVFNRPENVALAVDKLKCLQTLKDKGVKTVPFTTSNEDAGDWKYIVARTLTRVSQGRGIILCTPDDIPKAPLYTKYLGDDRKEYRVHVMGRDYIDYQKRVPSSPTPDLRIRSRRFGWDLARRGFEPVDSVIVLAIRAVEALGLDFGAVDIIRDPQNQNYVLEVNTAPKLNNEGIEIYTKALKELINE